MSTSSFHFKQFTIHQDKCAMKVGTDAVLLGAWTQPNNATLILDIGTGTGIIAIMLAQKSNAQIDAIEIDADACIQAKENSQHSPWADRLHISHESLQHRAAKAERTVAVSGRCREANSRRRGPSQGAGRYRSR